MFFIYCIKFLVNTTLALLNSTHGIDKNGIADTQELGNDVPTKPLLFMKVTL
jgi:hypothetical protein